MQPAIVYDETIRRDNLKNYKVLVMPYCDVLTESVAKAITSFQKRGGTSTNSLPGYSARHPAAVLQPNTPHEDKAALQKMA